ncbi:hypothetical protein BD289DRAFT_479438 [Coniella lustricola]|uniref:Uncharacterized protein n=1 Tax=Coniella lustricola TaxID=2025994 RepID=A0A2T3AJ28_9PEZI|nr:hypothetical protein BD289DRAFT_479438 [Coniella lustricola]
MSPPPPQSRFVEGSMNDRTSNAPPSDFMGPESEEYERHFAMDWKPPDLGDFADSGHDDYISKRPSFTSTASASSVLTTASTATTKGPKQNGSGFFKQVKERFALTRSKSSFGVPGSDEGDGLNNSNEGPGFFVPPAFKHKRSESMGPPAHQQLDLSFLKKGPDRHGFARANTIATAPTTPVSATTPLSPLLPGFDPSKRPTREEIAANYQNLLASGFFGTHAIQSTRFSPPGKALHGQDQTVMPPLAQRFAGAETGSQGIRTVPPSPERMPPPPPPKRNPPQPPSISMDVDMDVDMETDTETNQGAPRPPADVPASNTMHRIVSPAEQAARAMPPPPLPQLAPAKKLRPAHNHSYSSSAVPSALTRTSAGNAALTIPSSSRPGLSQHSLSFSSVPYNSTAAGTAPLMSAKPPTATAPPPRAYRPPPHSAARFSTESTRPRSFDLVGLARGTKRPFVSSRNSSQTSFASSRPSYDSGAPESGIGVATSTPDEGKLESGARKFVKRLRRSASKVSLSLGRSGSHDNDDDEMIDDYENNYNNIEQTASRTSMSSNVKRSFSIRFGGGGKSRTTPDATPSPMDLSRPTSSQDEDNYFSLKHANRSHDTPTSPAPVTPNQPILTAGLSTIVGSPNNEVSPERKFFNRSEMRTRRLRRRDSDKSSPSVIPLAQLPVSMGGHGPAANSEVQYRNGLPTPRDGESPPGTTDSSDSGMDGVEFSFHFPGRMKPGGGPLAQVSDANRGVTMSSAAISGAFKGISGSTKRIESLMGRGGSVRVVPSEVL